MKGEYMNLKTALFITMCGLLVKGAMLIVYLSGDNIPELIFTATLFIFFFALFLTQDMNLKLIILIAIGGIIPTFINLYHGDLLFWFYSGGSVKGALLIFFITLFFKKNRTKIGLKIAIWFVLLGIIIHLFLFLSYSYHIVLLDFIFWGSMDISLFIFFVTLLRQPDQNISHNTSEHVQIVTPIVKTGKFAIGFTGGILGGIIGGVLFGIGTIIAMFLGCGMMAKSPTAELIVSTIIAGVMGFVMAAMTTEEGKDEPRGGCFIPMLYALGGFLYVKASQMLLISIPSASPIETRLAFANWNIETLMVSTGGFLLFSAILGGVLGMIRGSIAGIDWGKK